MNGHLRNLNLVKNLNKFNYPNSIRTLYNDHLKYVKGEKTIQVEEDNDQKMFACVHFEPTFPYEHTKSLPKQVEKKVEDSILRNDIANDEMFKRDLTMLEVQKLTYTSEYFWKKNYDFKKTYNKKKLKPRDGI